MVGLLSISSLGGGLHSSYTLCCRALTFATARLSVHGFYQNIFSARQYTALYAIVRPSVIRVNHTKTVKVRINKLSSNGSPIPLVSAGQVSSRNSNGFPQAGASNKGGVDKTSHFTKTVGDTRPKLLLINQ